MEKRTIEQLESALNAVCNDLAPRVEELAQKGTNGLLTPEERKEYAEVVRLNDMLSLLKFQARCGGTSASRSAREARPG